MKNNKFLIVVTVCMLLLSGFFGIGIYNTTAQINKYQIKIDNANSKLSSSSSATSATGNNTSEEQAQVKELKSQINELQTQIDDNEQSLEIDSNIDELIDNLVETLNYDLTNSSNYTKDLNKIKSNVRDLTGDECFDAFKKEYGFSSDGYKYLKVYLSCSYKYKNMNNDNRIIVLLDKVITFKNDTTEKGYAKNNLSEYWDLSFEYNESTQSYYISEAKILNWFNSV